MSETQGCIKLVLANRGAYGQRVLLPTSCRLFGIGARNLFRLTVRELQTLPKTRENAAVQIGSGAGHRAPERTKVRAPIRKGNPTVEGKRKPKH